MADKLIIEIDGNASGLTNELRKADQRLNAFNSKIALSNKALGGFESKLGTSSNALVRLTTTTRGLDTNLKSINRTFNSMASSITRMSKAAAGVTTTFNATSKSASGAATSLQRLASSSSAVNNMMTSMGRRMAALNATISGLNTALRGVTRNIQQKGIVMGGTTTIINRHTAATAAAGVAAGRTAGQFRMLSNANLSLAEGFRRSVAQITALRTLTYQALFWFAPLVYSIIKVNSEYEKQMVLLKNISKETSEAAKAQEAVRSRGFLVDLAQNSPFALNEITNAFVKMKVGGVDPMNGSLQILLDSIAAFGGGSAELNRAAVAIQQMGGKGVISMEELRQQLGEHIPDAASAMAEGLGLSMGELFKVIESGTLESTNALAAMFEVLKSRHQGAAADMMNTWSGVVARLRTAWENFLIGVTKDAGPNSFMATLKKQAEELIKFFNTVEGAKFMADIQRGLTTVIELFATLVKFVVTYRDEIFKLGAVFAAVWGGNMMIGLITRIITAYSLLNSKLLAGIGLLGGTTAASGRLRLQLAALATAFMSNNRAASLMGVSTNRLNGALRTMNATGGMTIGTLGRMAAGAIAAQGAFLVFAAAIWAVVAAFQAMTAARERDNKLKNAAKIASEGGTFTDEAERATMLGNIQSLERVAKNSADPRTRARYQAQADEKRAQFNLLDQNWQRQSRTARVSHAETVYNEKLQVQINSARKPFDIKMAELRAAGGADPETMTKLQSQANAAEQKVLQRQLAHANTMAETPGANQSIWQGIQKDLASRLEGAQTGGAAIGNVATTDGGDPLKGRDKGGSKGPKSDGLDGLRSRYANSEVRKAQAQHRLNDLMAGTDTIFDPDEAQDRAEAIAAMQTQEGALKNLINARKMETEELERAIFIEEGILDLNKDIIESELELNKAMNLLMDDYVSVGTEVDSFAEKLRVQYSEEMKAAESAIAEAEAKRELLGATEATNAAVDDAVERYDRLIGRINSLTDSYQALLIVQAAQEAKEANEKYGEKFLTQSDVDLRDIDREIARYSEVLRMTQQQQGQISFVDENGDVFSPERERAYRAELAQTVPILQQRLAILERERQLASLGPAASPLARWADANARTTDQMKESFGNLLADSMDSFVDDLARGKVAFGDFVKSMIKGLVAIIIRALIAKAILGALGLSGPASLVSDVNANIAANPAIFHSGGIVGRSSTPSRTVDGSMFAFAKRYHTGGIVGLGSNEVPIIAEKGEGVFTQEQMKALGKEKSGSNVQVNVINQTGTEAQVERKPPRFDGEKWVEDIILKKLTSPGPVRNVLGSMGKK